MRDTQKLYENNKQISLRTNPAQRQLRMQEQSHKKRIYHAVQEAVKEKIARRHHVNESVSRAQLNDWRDEIMKTTRSGAEIQDAFVDGDILYEWLYTFLPEIKSRLAAEGFRTDFEFEFFNSMEYVYKNRERIAKFSCMQFFTSLSSAILSNDTFDGVVNEIVTEIKNDSVGNI